MNTNVKSKKLIIAVILLVVALFSCLFGTRAMLPAYADMGPKPSVIVTVENLDGKVCYGTLLSYKESLGPTAAYSPEHPYIPEKFDPESEYYDAEEHAIWEAFVGYADSDGYYYQQRHWSLHETGKISWTYYPPSKFKVLLYFPETQTFVTSSVCESYAFHSYFGATLSDTDVTVSQTQSLNVRKNYNYTWEIFSLLIRTVATVLVELGTARLFRWRTKKKLLTVTIVNAVTQTAMNVALNVLVFLQGAWALIWYIPIELAVFVTEAVAYAIIFRRKKNKTAEADGGTGNPDCISVGMCVLFSLVANLLSFSVGFLLIPIIPGIF